MSSDEARTLVEEAARPWPAPERARLLAALDTIMATEPSYVEAPVSSDDALAEARSAADLVRSGEDSPFVRSALEALPPDDAGRLAEDLLTSDRADLLAQVLRQLDPRRLPAGRLLEAACARPTGVVGRALVLGVSLTTTLRLLHGIEELVGQDGLAPGDVAELVEDVAAARVAYAGRPYQWWDTTVDLQPMGRPTAEPPTTHAEPPGGDLPPKPPVFRDGDAPATVTSYPRLDVATGTARPDVVVIDQPFTVTIGIQGRRMDPGISTGARTFDLDAGVTLDAVLVFDPQSIEVTGSPRVTLPPLTTLNQYPAADLTCVARSGDGLTPERRIGLHLLLEGQVVGVAWRTLVAVGTPDRVGEAVVRPQPERELLDLAPLVDAEAPDLVISVTRSDLGSENYVWTAFSSLDAVEIPDLPRTGNLAKADGDAFATETRRMFLQKDGVTGQAGWLELAGRATRIGRGIPEGIRRAIGATLKQSTDRAPSILLLTEELDVPWELAWFDELGVTRTDKVAPFLGAHAAISRWPLTDHTPRPELRPSVAVNRAAVLTADYTGVPSFPVLESAQEEATKVAALFGPPELETAADQIKPDLDDVMKLFTSRPSPHALVHVALHGKFDNQGNQEGIVLLQPSPAGGAVGIFLTPTMLETGSLEAHPFVFLNACQIGANEMVLGDYGGFALTLLRIGAAGVVAPLWNVRDTVAAEFAAQFYAATWGSAPGADAVSVAEAVRALRARYTQDGVTNNDPMADPTVIAYQVFGHPSLHLTRP